MVKKFLKSIAGATSLKTIVTVAVGFLLVAILTPIGMTELVGANTTGWETAVKTVFSILLPVLYVVGVALYFIPRGR